MRGAFRIGPAVFVLPVLRQVHADTASEFQAVDQGRLFEGVQRLPEVGRAHMPRILKGRFGTVRLPGEQKGHGRAAGGRV